MAPTNYMGPRAKDKSRVRTYTQNTDSNLRPAGEHYTVADILAEKGQEVYSVSPGDTLREAIAILRDQRIGALAVLSDDRHLRGILSERDVIAQIDDDGQPWMERPVLDVMTADPITCKPADALLTILRRMTDGNFRHMPVVDDDGRLAGLVSIRDVVRMRLTELEYEALRMKQMIVG